MEASVATRSKISEYRVNNWLLCVKVRGGLLSHTIDERVQDGHGTVGNTSVGVDLLED